MREVHEPVALLAFEFLNDLAGRAVDVSQLNGGIGRVTTAAVVAAGAFGTDAPRPAKRVATCRSQRV